MALKIKSILSVDPSINRCGIAVYRGKKLVLHQLVQPEDKTGNEFEKSLSVFYQVKAIRAEYGTYKTILEVPVHWENEGFVARESGSIYKLSLVVGMLYTLGDVQTVPPHGWKQQLPKNVVRNRLKPLYPNIVTDKLDHNIMDAIGIGHWFLHGTV